MCITIVSTTGFKFFSKDTSYSFGLVVCKAKKITNGALITMSRASQILNTRQQFASSFATCLHVGDSATSRMKFKWSRKKLVI